MRSKAYAKEKAGKYRLLIPQRTTRERREFLMVQQPYLGARPRQAHTQASAEKTAPAP